MHRRRLRFSKHVLSFVEGAPPDPFESLKERATLIPFSSFLVLPTSGMDDCEVAFGDRGKLSAHGVPRRTGQARYAFGIIFRGTPLKPRQRERSLASPF
ncbi:MAG: hypothetical protein EXR50_02740 [Dehalococcoidia bacterium]|nr:hypothetical protein [Dehalococcoidia bacterium]